MPFKILEELYWKPAFTIDSERSYVCNYGNQDAVQQIEAHLLYQPACKSILVPTFWTEDS